MKGIFRKDMLYIRQNIKFYAGMIILFSIAGIASNGRSADFSGTLMLPLLYGAMIPHTLLSHDTQSHFLQTIGIFPVSRRQYIGEKYLFTLLCMGVMVVYMALVITVDVLYNRITLTPPHIASLLLYLGSGFLFPAVSIPLWTLLCNLDRSVYICCSALMGGLLGAMLVLLITISGRSVLTPQGASLLLLGSLLLFGVSFFIADAIFRRKDIH